MQIVASPSLLGYSRCNLGSKVKRCSRWFHSQIIAVPELTLDMNTLKKATFSEAFIYTVYNHHARSMVTANMQYKYIDTKQTKDKHKTKDCSSRNLFAYGSMNLPIFSTPSARAHDIWKRVSSLNGLKRHASEIEQVDCVGSY